MEEYTRKLGAIPDEPDSRDYLLKAKQPAAVEEQTVFYLMTPARDQGDEGTCVGFAGTAVKEYFDNSQRGTMDVFSPRFLYYHCKQRDGIPNQEGTYPRIAMQVLQDVGVAWESDWPYKPNQTDRPEIDPQRAATQKIVSYARLTNIDDMYASLVLNGPFLIAVQCTSGFWTADALKTGRIDETKTDNFGGHALCVCGYDAQTKLFKIKNSWGDDYGDNGYNWASGEWLSKYVYDAWAIVDSKTLDKHLVLIVPEPDPQPEPEPQPEPTPEPEDDLQKFVEKVFEALNLLRELLEKWVSKK